MPLSPWFILPLAAFVVLSVIRVWLAVAHFDKHGSMPEHSFDIVAGNVVSIELLGALLTAATAILGGERLALPKEAVAIVSVIALLLAIGAVTGFYLKAMVPRFQKATDKRYRFKNAWYPSVKAISVTAGFVAIASAACFVVYLVFNSGSISTDGDKHPTQSPAGVPAETQ